MNIFRLILLGSSVFLVSSAAHSLSCEGIYTFTNIEKIEYYNLEDLVLFEDSIFSGIYLEGHVFRTKQFSSWSEVFQFYRDLPLAKRRILKHLLTQRKGAFAESLNNLFELAKQQNADLTYRFKDIDSLKNKIFDRVEVFEKKGLQYTLTDLADVVGFRLTLQNRSELLNITSKEAWAEALKLPLGAILEVEIKGSREDIQSKKFYSAIHLNILGSEGQNFEVQIMTKAMSVWHKWDHENVYKPKTEQPNLVNLRNYSRAWGAVLNRLSSLQSSSQVAREMQLILAELNGSTKSNWTKSFLELDRLLLKDAQLKTGFSDQDLRAISESFL